MKNSDTIRDSRSPFEHRNSRIYMKVKRMMDVVLGILLLLPALLLMAFGFAGSALVHRSNPLYLQKRTGLGGNPFTVYKIKTMHDFFPEGDNSDTARLTVFGNLLRRSSIDELPQIFNILKGEMSFIGPRPQMHEYFESMPAYARRRCDVVPGLSGWSQVNGRNGITWEQRFEQDLWYVENANFRLDLWIIWLTVLTVIRGHNVHFAPGIVMQEFEPLEQEPSVIPPILEEIRAASPDSVVSFSLHDPDELRPVVTDPRSLFDLESPRQEKVTYANVYIDIWRRPNAMDTAFPLGTAGPFKVMIDHGCIFFEQLDETRIRHRIQKKHRLDCVG